MGKADVKSARERRVSRDCDLTVGVPLAPDQSGLLARLNSPAIPGRLACRLQGRLCTNYAPPTIGLTVTPETRLSKEKGTKTV
jgi:hypothetical protein